MTREKLVEVRNLKTFFQVENETAKAVDGLDFDIFKGEILGIVGESGSGKSVTSLSLIQLIPNPPGDIVDGDIIFKGEKIFDGEERKRVMAYPEYRFFAGLTGNLRSLALPGSLIGWLLIVVSLPVQGVLLKLGLLLGGIIGLVCMFVSSPRKKQFRTFRDTIYKRIRDIRGREIAMIFQEPMTSLNPVFTVGLQIIESIEAKGFFDFFRDWVLGTGKKIRGSSNGSRIKVFSVVAFITLFISQLTAGWTFELTGMLTAFAFGGLIPVVFSLLIVGMGFLIPKQYIQKSEELFQRGVKLLDLVGIPDPEQRMSDYPHQFSGGMRQRAMIAMALAKDPSLLIADEPTTALDVTIQAQILDLMKELKNQRDDAAIVLITHDLAVVAEMCERVIVMYGGKIQEVAEIKELFKHPMHPYTRGLLSSIPNPTRQEKGHLQAIRGMVPNILKLPQGCKFCTRCDDKLEKCDLVEPQLIEYKPDHFVRCFLYEQDSSLNNHSPDRPE